MGARLGLPLRRLCGIRSATSGNTLPRHALTNGLRVDGMRDGFEVIERHNATLAAENDEDEGFASLHREA